MSEMHPLACKHGSLRRSCEICDLQEQVAELEAQVKNLECQEWLDHRKDERLRELNDQMAKLAKWQFGPLSIEWSWVTCAMAQQERITELEAQLAAKDADIQAYRRSAPLCESHQPSGGARGGCVICNMIELSRAIGQIDYALGPPNDMNVSGYDVHCDPRTVVDRVKAEIERLRKVADQAISYGQCTLTTCDNHCARNDTVWNHCTGNHAVMPELADYLRQKEEGK